MKEIVNKLLKIIESLLGPAPIPIRVKANREKKRWER